MRIDHVVFWVADPVASVEWYMQVLGLEGVRVEEHKAGKALFPSVRVAPDALIDLMPARAAAGMNAMAPGSAGNKVNHVCLAMTRAEYDALAQRLAARDVKTVPMKHNFGALGVAPETFYFQDPDGNVLEARHYE
jgi:catechol 2,3-dioxygenase-like lactoylglutathione lyase family enzyme